MTTTQMDGHKELSQREAEVVELSVQGLTNEAIAQRMGLTVGTVNTYWLRIRMKVGGLGRTDTVVKVITERSDRALRAANVERESLLNHLAERNAELVDLRSGLALLEMALSQIHSTVFATDTDLRVHMMANGEMPAVHFGVEWEVGRTVQEIFKSSDPHGLAVETHMKALQGTESTATLSGQFQGMTIRVRPLEDENGTIIGCLTVANSVQESIQPE